MGGEERGGGVCVWRCGGGCYSNISVFLSSEHFFLDRKIGQVRGGGWCEERRRAPTACSFSTNISLAVVIIGES